MPGQQAGVLTAAVLPVLLLALAGPIAGNVAERFVHGRSGPEAERFEAFTLYTRGGWQISTRVPGACSLYIAAQLLKAS